MSGSEGTEGSDRVSESTAGTAGYYLREAKRVQTVLESMGAFDKSVSRLPIFLFAVGLTIFGAGVVLFTYEPGFESSEFQDFVFFAMVLVVASVAVYIGEIRLREAIDHDKGVLSDAQVALAKAQVEIDKAAAQKPSMAPAATDGSPDHQAQETPVATPH